MLGCPTFKRRQPPDNLECQVALNSVHGLELGRWIDPKRDIPECGVVGQPISDELFPPFDFRVETQGVWSGEIS